MQSNDCGLNITCDRLYIYIFYFLFRTQNLILYFIDYFHVILQDFLNLVQLVHYEHSRKQKLYGKQRF